MKIIILGPAPSASVYVALQLCTRRNNPQNTWGIPAPDLSAASPLQPEFAAPVMSHKDVPMRINQRIPLCGAAIVAGGAIISGLPYGVAGTVAEAFERMQGRNPPTVSRLQSVLKSASNDRGPWPSISIWHGTHDQTVRARNANHQAMERRARPRYPANSERDDTRPFPESLARRERPARSSRPTSSKAWATACLWRRTAMSRSGEPVRICLRLGFPRPFVSHVHGGWPRRQTSRRLRQPAVMSAGKKPMWRHPR